MSFGKTVLATTLALVALPAFAETVEPAARAAPVVLAAAAVAADSNAHATPAAPTAPGAPVAPADVPGTSPRPGETVFLEHLRGVITIPAAEQAALPVGADFSGVDVSRTSLLADRAATLLIGLFLDKPMSFGSADRLCTALRTWLRSVGQPFVEVYVPPQDVTSGVVRVVVQRARLDGELQVEGAKWFSESFYRKSLQVNAGEEIDAARIKAGVDQLNDSAYRRVAIAAEPGADKGTTRLVLRAQELRPWELTAGWNNTGTVVTDENRANLGFKWGNAWGRGDVFSYNFTADPHLEHSRSHSTSYDVNLESGRALALFGSWSRIESALPEPLTQQGSSWQAGLRYGIPFATTDNGWTRDLSFGADFKYSDNTLEFAAIPITDNATHIVQAGVTYALSRRAANSSTWLSTSVYGSPGGLSDHNKNTEFGIARAGAKASYVYARLDGGFSRPLPYRFSINLMASVQAASGPLLGSEQLNGGGSGAVRGYRESTAFGDGGALVRTELHAPAFSILKPRDVVDTFVFVDRAVLDTRGPGGDTFGLGSGGLGLNYRLGRAFTLSGAFGWQFHEPPTASARRPYYGHLNVSTSF